MKRSALSLAMVGLASASMNLWPIMNRRRRRVGAPKSMALVSNHSVVNLDLRIMSRTFSK